MKLDVTKIKTKDQLEKEEQEKRERQYNDLLKAQYKLRLDNLTLEAILKANKDNPLFAEAWAERMAIKKEIGDLNGEQSE